MISTRAVRASKSFVALVSILFAISSQACYEIESLGDLKVPDGYQTHNTTGHNVGRLAYNASLDGWVIVESYYDPLADAYKPESGDFVWHSSTGSNSILFIPSSGSGGGGTPPGPPGNPPPTIPHAERPASKLTADPGVMSCGYGIEPPKKLEDIGVIGSAISPIRNWLGGVGTGWAIIRSAPGGGGGSQAGTTPENPRSTPGEARICSAEELDRVAEAAKQIRAAVGALGCVRQLHRGRYWKVDFPGGESGVYRGTSDCRFSINNVEIEAPSC